MEKIKNKIKDKLTINNFINSIWFAIIIGILIFLKTMFFYKETIYISNEFEKDVVMRTVVFILSLMFIIFALPKKARTITTIAVSIFISVLLFVDDSYYTFSSNIISVEQITNLQYGEEILGSLPTVIKWKDMLYFIDLIIIMLLFVFKFVDIKKQENPRRWKLSLKVLACMLRIKSFL